MTRPSQKPSARSKPSATARRPAAPSSRPAAHDAHRASSATKAIRADRQLVDQCLCGDPAAWQQLYRQHHSRLTVAIAKLLPDQQNDINVVDEIAARVWYALVRNRAELLSRFDPARGRRLADFLGGIARMVARHYLRSERRRRRYERAGARKLTCRKTVSDSELAATFDEFNGALTASEQHFIKDVLLSAACSQLSEGQRCSGSNLWQRRHRLRAKLLRFLLDAEPEP